MLEELLVLVFNSFAFMYTSSVLNFIVLLGLIHSDSELFVIFVAHTLSA